MKLETVRALIMSSVLRKVMALFSAWSIWLIISAFYPITVVSMLPVLVKNESPDMSVTVEPDRVQVLVRGLRKRIRSLKDTCGNLVITSAEFSKPGIYTVPVISQQSDLLEGITMLTALPKVVTVKIESKAVEVAALS